MLSILTFFASILKTYFQSLKKDLSLAGFDPTLLVASISYVSLILLAGLSLMGRFQLPTEPLFYVYWFFLTLIAMSGYILFVKGISHAQFMAANSFSHLGFVMTAVYAYLILGEVLSLQKVLAILLALVGAMLFFEWRVIDKKALLQNRGLLLILFSVILGPLGLIFYKLAIAHTGSYHQFLTGRFVMDFVYGTLFFLLFFRFVIRKNPLKQSLKFISSTPALVFMFGMALVNTLDSWLIYKLPASLFALLGIVSIPAGYLISKVKYHEIITTKHFLGGLLIIVALFIFIML
ncbi:MAG: EamA family transporter [Candidatus Paceibacterota bacterium]